MRKLFVLTAMIFIVGTVLTASSPSLDGRAVVADAGEFPAGLFAKTVGYLPGDSINVTNPANGEKVDILVIGSLDPSQGIAIQLSPEAANALGIKKNSNNVVKLTKRNGSADECVYGSAVIADAPEAPQEEITTNIDKLIASEEPADETIEEIEELEEEIADLETEEEVISEEIESVEEELASVIAEEEALEEEIAAAETEEEEEALEEELAVLEEEEEALEEELAELEEEEEGLEEEVAELEEEIIEEELPEEAVESEEVEEELAELEEDVPEEAVEEEILPEEEFASEYVDDEELPEEELASEYVDEEELPEEEIASEAFQEDEIPQEAVVEETVIAEETPEEEPVEETSEDEDTYEAIVLVPSDDNPPMSFTADEIEEEAVEEPEVEPVVEKTTAVSYKTVKELEKGKFYVQIAVYTQIENVQGICDRYGKKYPITVLDNGNRKMVLVGPLSVDEYGIVLERFKAYGFKDAFVKKGK